MKEEQAQKAATQQATSITPQTEQATQRPLTRAEAIAQTGERLRIQTPGAPAADSTIKGGASGTNYVAILTVVTTEGRVLDFRCAVRVNDVTEPQ